MGRLARHTEEEKDKALQPPPPRKDAQEKASSRTKPPGLSMTPTEMMRECLGMDVSVRTTSGNTWQGLLAEVKGNGTIVLKPARELHYGKPELLEKELVASEVLWLRRNPKTSDVLVGASERGPAAPERRWPIDQPKVPKAQDAQAEGEDAATQICKNCQSVMPTGFTFKFCGMCGSSLKDDDLSTTKDVGDEVEGARTLGSSGSTLTSRLLEEKHQAPTPTLKPDGLCLECDWSAVCNDEFCRRCGHFLPTDAVFA